MVTRYPAPPMDQVPRSDFAHGLGIEVAERGHGRLLAVGRATYLVGGAGPARPEEAAADAIDFAG